MNSSYLNKYTIVQIYKSNEFQKVYIATDNSNGQAVVINNMLTTDNDYVWDVIEKDYENIFDNILHLERHSEGIVLVSKVEEGLSLKSYLDNEYPSFSERVSLIGQYLSSIIKYDSIPNSIKMILVDESQIILDNGIMSLDELIILNEPTTKVHNFNPVVKNITAVLKTLTKTDNIDYDELPLYIKIVGFIDELQRNTDFYYDIEQICNGFNNLEVRDLYTINSQDNLIITQKSILSAQQNIPSEESSPLVGRRVGTLHEDEILDHKSGKISKMVIGITAASIIVVSATAGFLIKSDLIPASIFPEPSAIVDDIQSDTPNNVDIAEDNMPPNSEIIHPNENITYVSEYIKEDYSVSKISSFSLSFSGAEDSTHKIAINQGPILKDSQLLMWVKSDSEDTFKIKVTGYSSSAMVFSESVSHKPTFANGWELVQFSFHSDIADNIDIVFSDVKGNVWIDKISIDFFK